LNSKHKDALTARDVRFCDKLIKTDELILCIDCGSSFVKTLLLDADGILTQKYEFDQFPYDYINSMAEKNKCIILLTGARAGHLDLFRLPADVIQYSEIDCIASIPKSIRLEETVVVCIGTGTPFIVYKNGVGVHFGGTGIGGGTFLGLSYRLLKREDPKEVEQLARNGDLSKINLTIADVYQQDVSYLKSDLTAANFAKRTEASESDIALGIHSMISETIGMMAAQIARSNGIDNVLFCGAVCENALICDSLEKCMGLFNIKSIFIDNPGFGTCFGAFSYYFEQKKQPHIGGHQTSATATIRA